MYRQVCKETRREIRKNMTKAIQEAVDGKEPNALYAGRPINCETKNAVLSLLSLIVLSIGVNTSRNY